MRLRALAAVLLTVGSARADDIWTASRDKGQLRTAAWCGIVEQQILASNRTFTFRTLEGASLPFDLGRLGAMQSIASDIGLRVYVKGPVYVSLEGLFGGVFMSTVRDKPDALAVPSDVRFSAEGGSAVGVDLTPRALIHASLEAYAGARVFTFFLYHAAGVRRVWYGEGVLEPRGRVSVRVASQITLGIWAGTNLVQPGESRFGLTLTIHMGERRIDRH